MILNKSEPSTCFFNELISTDCSCNIRISITFILVAGEKPFKIQRMVRLVDPVRTLSLRIHNTVPSIPKARSTTWKAALLRKILYSPAQRLNNPYARIRPTFLSQAQRYFPDLSVDSYSKIFIHTLGALKSVLTYPGPHDNSSESFAENRTQ